MRFTADVNEMIKRFTSGVKQWKMCIFHWCEWGFTPKRANDAPRRLRSVGAAVTACSPDPLIEITLVSFAEVSVNHFIDPDQRK